MNKLFAWQGWRMQVPEAWNPVRLEGTWGKGYALLADLDRSALAIRWDRPRANRFDPTAWAEHALREEVGTLATDEARSPEEPDGFAAARLYIDPEPPGRDVFVAHSPATGRVLQLVHHPQRRQRVFADEIVPSLADTAADEPSAWAVFELSCATPAGWALTDQRLMAGDLGLFFARPPNGTLAVRQVAVAQLALQRMPLAGWNSHQQSFRLRHFRPESATREVELKGVSGQIVKGLAGSATRRRRFFWDRRLPARVVTYALHDEKRDRLVLVDCSDEECLREVAATVGFN